MSSFFKIQQASALASRRRRVRGMAGGRSMHGAGADAFEGEDELAALMTGSQRQHTPLAALAAREYNINMDMNARGGTECGGEWERKWPR